MHILSGAVLAAALAALTFALLAYMTSKTSSWRSAVVGVIVVGLVIAGAVGYALTGSPSPWMVPGMMIILAGVLALVRSGFFDSLLSSRPFVYGSRFIQPFLNHSSLMSIRWIMTGVGLVVGGGMMIILSL